MSATALTRVIHQHKCKKCKTILNSYRTLTTKQLEDMLEQIPTNAVRVSMKYIDGVDITEYTVFHDNVLCKKCSSEETVPSALTGTSNGI